jgi:hypothetical protein
MKSWTGEMKCPPVKEKIKIEEWNIRVLITH